MGRKEETLEVLYSDEVCYKGWLSSFNFSTGKWIVQFYDDNETTESRQGSETMRIASFLNAKFPEPVAIIYLQLLSIYFNNGDFCFIHL